MERPAACSSSAARQVLPKFLEHFQHEPLLVTPLSHGGNPRLILRAGIALTLLRALAANLPRIGLLRETYGLLRVAQTMERQQKLEQAAEQSAEARWLATIPGIGPYLAMVILAEIGDIARFSDKKALCNYAGLVPRVRESAGHRQDGGLSYQGSKLLRWAMIQATQGATRGSPAVRAWYEQRRQRKRPQVARVALARKLLTCVWALLRHGVSFEETVFATR